jgi:hypothetical protein
VKTRNLVLLALACGLVILVAGVAFLARLVLNEDDLTVEVLAVGESAVIDDVAVAVTGSTVTDATLVDVTIDNASASRVFAGAGWSLQVDGELRPVLDGDVDGGCAGQEVAPGASLACRLTFANTDDGGIVSYALNDEQRQWALG